MMPLPMRTTSGFSICVSYFIKSSPGLFAAVGAPRTRRLVQRDLIEPRQFRVQLIPEPPRHVLDRWVLQSRNLIEISMIEHLHQRPHTVGNHRMVIEYP